MPHQLKLGKEELKAMAQALADMRSKARAIEGGVDMLLPLCDTDEMIAETLGDVRARAANAAHDLKEVYEMIAKEAFSDS